MATIYFESDTDPELIRGKRVLMIGYGSQGSAQALNLMDSGVDVRVALKPNSRSRDAAEAAGFFVQEVEEGVHWADVIVFCTPDVTMGDLYCEDVDSHLKPGQTLLFAHGYAIRYGYITPPPFVSVVMVAPKGPGVGLRNEYISGNGLPSLVAVHQDPAGDALQIALSYAWGIGCARSLILETTFREETETDLFGEQAVLCGGIPALVKAGYETLIEAGYQPELAYFECLHETKLIVDLLYRGGLERLRSSISDTAEWGGYVAEERLVTEQTREAMRGILSDIQDGSFARTWRSEHQSGRPNMRGKFDEEIEHPVEPVGKALRAVMPWLD